MIDVVGVLVTTSGAKSMLLQCFLTGARFDLDGAVVDVVLVRDDLANGR